MKTKTKILVLAEIVIVLCSLFFVALPAIAADQHVQKVSANTITTTADRPTYEHTDLDVFGNANEDDTIDMRDTTYIKLVIFGKKPETELADANYDGKISMLDVGQTKLIILGQEKKLTFIDIFGEAETVNKPIKRLAHLGWRGIQVTRMLGARDIIVCTGLSMIPKLPVFYPEISKLPAVGYKPDSCDFEMILSLKPDAVQPNLEARWALNLWEEKREFEEKLPGMPIICLNMREIDVLSENVRTYGYILDREGEAEEFIDWFEGYINLFKTRTEGLSEDEKPRVYMESTAPYKMYCPASKAPLAIVLAGGRIIAEEIVHPGDPNYGSWIYVDPEFLVEQNPDFIFKTIGSNLCGYDTDDTSEAAAYLYEVLNRPELANVNAVKNKRVYVIGSWILGGAGATIIGTAYTAKMFHPDLFTDFNPHALHQEYVDKFCYIDFDVKEHGVFMYHPEEYPDGR